ncbi:MAG: LicD family protein [Agriterribacter sp.]
MKKSLYNFPPDERLRPLTNEQKVHTVLLRMLNILQMICDRHEIDFWLDYGTLLGAVRHKGFIPWV